MLTIYKQIVILFYAGSLSYVWLSKIRQPQYWAWLLMGLCSYLLSVTYWHLQLPNPPAITMALDAVVILVVLAYARAEWELWFASLFLLSFACSLFLMAAQFFNWSLFSLYSYTVVLEVLNILAALSVASGAAALRSGNPNVRPLRVWRSVFGFVLPAARKAPGHQ